MLTRAQVEAFAKTLLGELQSRGEYCLSFTEQGVRVMDRNGTTNYPTVSAFMLTYCPKLMSPETEVRLTCPVCGAWESTLLKAVQHEDRMRRHLPSSGGELKETLVEEQSPLCKGSLRPGQRR